jgi:2-oxoglutarate ferredoxin oxidoreductase subunit alpha
MPAILLADAVIGQMKEALRPGVPPFGQLPAKTWAVAGKQGRADQRVVKSLRLGQGEMEAFHWELDRRFRAIQATESRWEELSLDGAELVVTAYGSAARIARSAVISARAAGHRVGLLRPVTLAPFPREPYARVAAQGSKILCIELSTGQMVDDVRLATAAKVPVAFYGRPAGTGSLPTPEELYQQILLQLGDHA